MPDNLEGTSAVSSPATDELSLDAENQETTDEVVVEDQEAASASSVEADEKSTVSEEEWDPLSIVKNAVEKEKPEAKETPDGDQEKGKDASSAAEKDQKPEEGAEEELGEVTEEELGEYKPKTRKRIEGLLDDRQRLTDRVEALQPQAEQMEVLQNFMQEKSLSTDDVSELLVVGGLAMSENPKDLEQALSRVDEFRNQLLSHLGQLLPEDLQKKVDEGLLDEGSAKEVALSRVNDQRAANKIQRAESTVQATQQQSEQSQQQVAAQGVHTAMNNWQSLKAGSDPDFKEKAPELAKEIELRVLRAGGTILDPHKAVEIAEEAYKTVNETFQRYRPAKAPEAKRMTQSKAAPTNMASKPGSALDAARAGLERANG